METQSPRTNHAEVEPKKAEKSREKLAAEERKSRPWKREVMTVAQLQEFQMQAVAYRYIAAGHPVPLHLVVPIWNSFALSWSHYLPMNNLHHHPYRLSYQELYQRDMVDPEPTRCRRTDGKKWRCGNNVLPFQKYCERHMHRGRKRSRKLVESSEIASKVSVEERNNDNDSDSFRNQSLHHSTMASSSRDPVVTIASYADVNVCEEKSNTIEDTVSRSSIVSLASTNKSVSDGNETGRNMDLNGKDETNRVSSENFIMNRVKPMEFYSKNLQGNDRLPSAQCEPKYKPERYPERSGKQCSSSEDGLFIRRYFLEHLRSGTEVSGPSLEAENLLDHSKKDTNAKSRLVNSNYSMKWRGRDINGCMVPGIHFSPDSVLQAHGGFPLNRAETENEPGRCRRTDGKKWRCSKDALPFQKYCPRHMHRGVKKRPANANANANSSSVLFSLTETAGSASCKDRDENVKLNTNLSVSILGQDCDEKSTSSCSTDTTLTDTERSGV